MAAAAEKAQREANQGAPGSAAWSAERLSEGKVLCWWRKGIKPEQRMDWPLRSGILVPPGPEGERSLGPTLVSDAALLALWPSTDSGDEDLGEEAQVDAVIRTGSVTPTGEAEVREPAEEGGTADQDLIATGCASITERAFCQRLQCPWCRG